MKDYLPILEDYVGNPKSMIAYKSEVFSRFANITFCKLRCLLSEACDMFSFSSGICTFLPHVPLKEVPWVSYTATSSSASVYVLHCATMLENILIGSDFETKSLMPGNWEIDTLKPELHYKPPEILEHMIASSQIRYVLSTSDEQFQLKTEIDLSSLPLGITEKYLSLFDQAFLLKVVATPLSKDCQDINFVLNGVTLPAWKFPTPPAVKSGSCIAHTLLDASGFSQPKSTLSVVGEGLSDIGGLELLINMPVNLGCFKVL